MYLAPIVCLAMFYSQTAPKHTRVPYPTHRGTIFYLFEGNTVTSVGQSMNYYY